MLAIILLALLFEFTDLHLAAIGRLLLGTNPQAFVGPMLADTAAVPFGDVHELERKLATRSFAAFVLEPIQAEGGVILPPDDYLQNAQRLCRRYGTLFVLDEVQTGLYRTGHFLAAHHFGVDPDMVVLAKALSGGLVPSGAVLMSDPVYASVYSSLKRAIVHTSTYGENSLAMRAGVATLDVFEEEQPGERATTAAAIRPSLSRRKTRRNARIFEASRDG